ncbi:DUF1492 domain-containing protein [Streptococcus gallolyticus subsp. gallolyticus]|uniref:DUF1492 domain-containing protein n=1 Tax=Streptococcus gallolyticus TaxID=315405 RepID=UPI002284B061|nr:DUF1492 domain-containing protein [Streptococcus gallolyticus]MCY7151272.1 DUF1492 domain-containing protein [Streptococcus gallolyticus subsp. gallolyticus]
MEIKDRLKSMYHKRLYIDSLKRVLERDREQLGIFPKYLAELEKESMERIAQEERDLQADLDLINSLDDKLQRNILTERYVNNLKWGDIADKLFYPRQTLFRHHNKALEQLTRHNQF